MIPCAELKGDELMPELPEVEVTRRGLEPELKGQTVTTVVCRVGKLRSPLRGLADRLADRQLREIRRRGKYLVWCFVDRNQKPGWLLTHLGMSGYWRLWPNPAPAPQKHDHVDIVFDRTTARLTDPRRFSDIRWYECDPMDVPPLSVLGFEPFDAALTPKVFAERMRRHKKSVKQVLMDGKVVVGCGNIYCSEALFQAGIDPRRSAARVSFNRYESLLEKIRAVLTEAIAAGGSTLRDFHGVEGQDGYFSLNAAVYGREAEPCRICGTPIRRIVQGQRSTFYCVKCQN